MNIQIILSGVYFNAVHWLSDHMLPCPIRSIFNADCPGCGFQRSVIALLQGDITKSLVLYPAAIPILLLFLLGIIHLKFKLKKGNVIIQYSYIFISIIIAVNFLFKIIVINGQ